jgi:OOP family OmpA-OmpF porin
MRTLAFVLLSLASIARAQDELSLDDFSSIRFYVAPGEGNYTMVEGTAMAPELAPQIGATLDYAHRPFVADDLDCQTGVRTEGCEPMTQETDLLGPVVNLQLYFAFTFLERVSVALNVPVLLFFEGERYRYIVAETSSPRTVAPGGSGGGLGDPRLSARVRILDPEDADGFSIAAGLWATAPVGHLIWPGHFVGDRYPTIGAHAIFEYRIEGFRAALNVGGQVREIAENVRSRVGPELTFGIAGAYRFDATWEAQVELTGATSFGLRFDSEAPMELRVTGIADVGPIAFHLGAGVGLFYGVGVPVFRIYGGGTFMPDPPRDSDGDGMLDDQDGCPSEAEDEDGIEDEDGCPDEDDDGDDVPAERDECNDAAEDEDGFEDEDGCPDEDNDGDGVRDGFDSCPDRAEDRDGDRDDDGCPDDDTDQDGIADDRDACVRDAEDFDDVADTDGCPETDADGDRVPDSEDECPMDAAPRRFRNGCPGGRAP